MLRGEGETLWHTEIKPVQHFLWASMYGPLWLHTVGPQNEKNFSFFFNYLVGVLRSGGRGKHCGTLKSSLLNTFCGHLCMGPCGSILWVHKTKKIFHFFLIIWWVFHAQGGGENTLEQ
jgi:hypothetical protein